MKTLLNVTCDHTSGDDLYLSYSEGPVAHTVPLNVAESVAIDFDEEGGVVGVEVREPDQAQLALLRGIAIDYDLSLDGFSYP